MIRVQLKEILLTISAAILSISVFSQTGAIDVHADIYAAVAQLNIYRKTAGLAPVKLSDSLSAGCTAHAKYLLLNKGNVKVQDMRAHEEYEELTGASPNGKYAGLHSDISYSNPSLAVNGWMKGFYHRIPLLQPSLTEIVIGYYKDGTDEVSLLECDAVGDYNTEPGVVFYPANNQEGVPLEMGPEMPSPVPGVPFISGIAPPGFPITIYFSAYQVVENVIFELRGKGNKIIPCFLSSPQHPASYFSQWNSICAIPKIPLEPGTKYFVSVNCKVDGKLFARKYSFTTVK